MLFRLHFACRYARIRMQLLTILCLVTVKTPSAAICFLGVEAVSLESGAAVAKADVGCLRFEIKEKARHIDSSASAAADVLKNRVEQAGKALPLAINANTVQHDRGTPTAFETDSPVGQ